MYIYPWDSALSQSINRDVLSYIRIAYEKVNKKQ